MQCKIYWELDVQNGPVREWSLSTENCEYIELLINGIRFLRKKLLRVLEKSLLLMIGLP